MSDPAAGQPAPGTLLGPAEIRRLAAAAGLRPTKRLGQNFLHDANTIRRIVRLAGVAADDHVLEVGPGLGSLTFGLLQAGARVTAVEIDPVLAGSVERTARARGLGERLTVLTADAMRIDAGSLPAAAPETTSADLSQSARSESARSESARSESARSESAGSESAGSESAGSESARSESARSESARSESAQPQLLVANLPYNVSVPVLLHLLETFDSLRSALVLVQAEVAERLAAPPGSKIYGVPSVKTAWYADVSVAGAVPRTVFWPVPNVDSALVRLVRHQPPQPSAGVSRLDVFALVDTAFAQRRKMLRSTLGQLVGSAQATQALTRAGIDPTARAETLTVHDFVRLANELQRRFLSG